MLALFWSRFKPKTCFKTLFICTFNASKITFSHFLYEWRKACSFYRKTVWTDVKIVDGSVLKTLKTEYEQNFGFPHIPARDQPTCQQHQLHRVSQLISACMLQYSNVQIKKPIKQKNDTNTNEKNYPARLHWHNEATTLMYYDSELKRNWPLLR